MKMKAMKLNYKTAKAEIVSVDKPTISSKQVLVNVRYAAIDTAVDEVVQQTFMSMFIHAKAKKDEPLVLGWHYSGTIAEIGSDVSEFQVKDEVWGFLQYEPQQKQGSFAEYIAVDVADCAPAPKGVKIDELTAASTEALTALQAIRDLGGLGPGNSILILGAGGGVGSAAVQIAKNLGAHVTAACSAKDLKRVRDFGADIVIDRAKKNPLTGTNARYDVVFDAPNKYSAVQSFESLNSKGTYVVTMITCSLFCAMFLSLFNGKKAKFIECHSKRDDLELIGQWMKEGTLKIDVDSTFDIKDLEKALERQNSKSKVGRVVLNVRDGWQ